MTQIKPEQIRWRVGSTNRDKTKALLLGYIDSRTAMSLLDELDPKWSDEYAIVVLDGSQGVQCALTANGVTRVDVGVPSNTEGLKGAYSDALKRAAVKHGLGRELYELPTIWVRLDERGRPSTEPTFVDGRWRVPQNAGTVIYDHEPIETPQPVARAAAATRPAPADEPRSGPAPASQGSGGDYEASPFADEMVDPLTGAAVAAAVGGEELPDKPEYVVKAERKAAGQKSASPLQAECPTHGAAKVKANKRGLYCASKMPDGSWCDWSQAVAA